jgi:fructose-1,6-bisphosphatase/inositol monophosphatase family enzyme
VGDAPAGPGGRGDVDAEALLEVFAVASAAVRIALEPVVGDERRVRTERAGQYAIDLIADAAALEVLSPLGERSVGVLSEESGRTGPPDAAVVVVVDPIDGSTNCARGLPYWCTSIAAVDADGLLCGYVVNHATGVATWALRGGGAWREGVRLRVAGVQRAADAVLSLDGFPRHPVRWKQYRVLGSQALGLCDLAAASVEGYVGLARTAPWDYAAGILVVQEAGGVVWSPSEVPLLDLVAEERRRVVAACTPELLDELKPMLA